MKNPQSIWVIINHEYRIIHQTTNPDHIELMRRYVRKAREAGDDWKLVQYNISQVIQCVESTKVTDVA